MSALFDYAKAILAKIHKPFVSCEVFAKVLTRNDDSGRHGVLIPSDAYSFFPHFSIPDPTVNATEKFPAFNPEWPEKIQEQWFAAFAKMQDMVKEK